MKQNVYPPSSTALIAQLASHAHSPVLAHSRSKALERRCDGGNDYDYDYDYIVYSWSHTYRSYT